METSDTTIEILKGIREEIRTTRVDLTAGLNDLRTEVRVGLAEVKSGLGEVKSGLAETNERLDRLERRQVEADVRVATELVAVVGVINGMRDDLRQDRVDRRRVDDHERRIHALEVRAG